MSEIDRPPERRAYYEDTHSRRLRSGPFLAQQHQPTTLQITSQSSIPLDVARHSCNYLYHPNNILLYTRTFLCTVTQNDFDLSMYHVPCKGHYLIPE
jgi:hypothetical protein